MPRRVLVPTNRSRHDRTSGPSRGIEAEHSTDLSSTQGGDQAIKAGPFDSAARRATKIVVNHVDVDEPASRERVVIPAPESCPCCGSKKLSKLGEDISHSAS
jgi:hypothetical protein